MRKVTSITVSENYGQNCTVSINYDNGDFSIKSLNVEQLAEILEAAPCEDDEAGLDEEVSERFGYYDDYSDDAYALASAGHGSDEDY